MFLKLFMHNNVMLRKKMKENEATYNIMMKDLMGMKRWRFFSATMNLIHYQNLKLITSTMGKRRWRRQWQIHVLSWLNCLMRILWHVFHTFFQYLECFLVVLKKYQVGLNCHAYGTSPWDCGGWMVIKLFEVLQIQVV